MSECLCVGNMGGGGLAVMMSLVLSLTGRLRGRRSSTGCGGRCCCSNVLRELASFVLGSPNTAAASSGYLHQGSWQIAHMHQKMYPQIIAHGRSPINQCISQQYLDILGNYLGRPYSSSIIPSLFPIHPDQLHCSIAACSTVKMRANARGCLMQNHPPPTSPFLRRGSLYYVQF